MELFGQAAVAGVLLLAASGKVVDASRSADFLSAIGIGAKRLTVAAAGLEALVALLLLSGLLIPLVCLVATTLTTAFVAVQLYAFWRGVRVDCGCFGPLDSRATPSVVQFGRSLSLASASAFVLAVALSKFGSRWTSSSAPNADLLILGVFTGAALALGGSVMTHVLDFKQRRPRIL